MSLFTSARHHLLSTANCSDPTVPKNGVIDPFLNTTDGAEMFFMCNPGFVPAGRMKAVCAANGSWTFDPAALVCKCEIIIGSSNYSLPSDILACSKFTALYKQVQRGVK